MALYHEELRRSGTLDKLLECCLFDYQSTAGCTNHKTHAHSMLGRMDLRMYSDKWSNPMSRDCSF